MKYLLLFLIALSFASCKKEIRGCMDAQANNYDAAANTPGVCTYDPTAMNIYSTVSSAGHGFINVYVDNVFQGTISSYFPNGAPGCNASGTVWLVVNPGNHLLHAETDDKVWNWDANIFCSLYACTPVPLD